jgi:hypothetical protein
MNKAIRERAEVLSPEISDENFNYSYALPKILSTEIQGNSKFQSLASSFIDADAANEAIASGLPYCVKLDSLFYTMDEYKEKRKFIESYSAGPNLMPIPSAKLLDSWYRFINDLVYYQGDRIYGTGGVGFKTIWKVTGRDIRCWYSNTPDRKVYDFERDRKAGNPCYIVAEDVFYIEREFLGVIGSISPTKEQMDAERPDSFIKSVQDYTHATILDIPEHEEYYSGYRVSEQGWVADDRYYTKIQSELVDIAFDVKYSKVHTNGVVESYKSALDVYGFSYAIDYNNQQYTGKYGEAVPSIKITTSYGNSFSMKTEPKSALIYECPKKYDFEYYDPPESETES